jgi:hypothetical protein
MVFTLGCECEHREEQNPAACEAKRGMWVEFQVIEDVVTQA